MPSQQKLAARADTSSQHELATRASSSRATSELEHGTRLAPLFARHGPLSAPLLHHRTADGALAAMSGTSSRATAERAATILYAQRHDGAFNKATICSTQKSFNLLTRLLHDSSLSLQSTFHSCSFYISSDRIRCSKIGPLRKKIFEIKN